MYDTAAACTPHCRYPGGECLPLDNVTLAADTECQVAGGYGHCSTAGVCRAGLADDRGQHWLVGLILFLVFYMLASLSVAYIYCMYCRGGRIRAKTSVTMSSVSRSDCDHVS